MNSFVVLPFGDRWLHYSSLNFEFQNFAREYNSKF